MTDAPKQPGALSRWLPMVIVGACLAGYFFYTKSPGALDNWSHDFDAAMAQARAENKPLVIAFHSPNCPPCYTMERTVLHDGPVVQTLKGMIPVSIDLFQRMELGQRFGVVGTPTYVLVSPEGEVLGKRMGFIPTDEFVLFLSQAFATSKTAAAAP